MSIDNHNIIFNNFKEGALYSKSFHIDKYSAKHELKKERLVLTKHTSLSLIISFILTTACFYLYIASVLNIYCIYQRRMHS